LEYSLYIEQLLTRPSPFSYLTNSAKVEVRPVGHKRQSIASRRLRVEEGLYRRTTITSQSNINIDMAVLRVAGEVDQTKRKSIEVTWPIMTVDENIAYDLQVGSLVV
jgi:hypothetical protein